MSGFLSRLASRALGRVDVRPRVPALFEPDSATPGIVATRAEDAVAVDADSTRPRQPRGPVEMAPASATRTMTTEVAVHRRVTTQREAAIVETPVRRPSTVAPPDARAAMPAPSAPPSDSRRTGEIAPAVHAVPATSRKPVDRTASMPAIVRRRRRDSAPSDTTVPSAERPVIQVTIGRIDVRAVTAPERAVRPAAPAAPSLTLDQYLEQSRRAR
jgi:hypothetical protein